MTPTGRRGWRGRSRRLSARAPAPPCRAPSCGAGIGSWLDRGTRPGPRDRARWYRTPRRRLLAEAGDVALSTGEARLAMARFQVGPARGEDVVDAQVLALLDAGLEPQKSPGPAFEDCDMRARQPDVVDDDRDVVVAAVGSRLLDEVLRSGPGVRHATQRRRDVLVGDLVGQTVAAQQQAVTLVGDQLPRVDLDLRVETERPRDDRPLRMDGGFLAGEPAL